MEDTYELLALRYATMQARTQASNFIFPDDHAAPDPLDFYVFVIRGAGRTYVVDTGYGQADADKRGRQLTCLPAEMLARVGIDAKTTRDVILTHMHWDHAGGIDQFPAATFHVQDAEMAYCTGRCMCHAVMRQPFDAEHVVAAVRALYGQRMRFHDGTTELAPGISLHLIGGHSKGIQCIRVRTKRGWVVLAGDTTHLWANLRKRSPFPIVVDMEQMLSGFDTLESLADGPDHIIPGHDPLILKRFPREGGDPDIVRVDLEPIA
jgi:glyoxylase-like metal-dependent hydrolase (beta-lactamase superfamily II)